MTDWKRIDGYENYEVSKYGEVRNINTGNYLNGCVNNCGYHKVGLTKGGKLKIFQLHRLVAQAFVPNPEKKEYVRHHDGDNLNNEALNLYWQSYDEFREWGDQQERARKKQ
jgi:hypothetical protein